MCARESFGVLASGTRPFGRRRFRAAQLLKVRLHNEKTNEKINTDRTQVDWKPMNTNQIKQYLVVQAQ